MNAYVLVRINILEAEKLKDYQQVAPLIIEKFGGRILARGGETVTLEGPELNRRIVVIEFPSLERAKAFYHSQEYQRAIEMRKDAADFEVVAIEGLDR